MFNTTLVDKVVAMKIEFGCKDRVEALEEVRRETDKTGSFYAVAETFNVLVNDSGEDFAMQFMSTYNKEIRPIY